MKPFVITGIPRSGTSILSKYICLHAENAYCINEVLYNVPTLRKELAAVAGWLIGGCTVPNKYSGKELLENLGGENVVEERFVDKEFDGDILIGSKVQTMYLREIQNIIAQDLPIIAAVRDPVYTIASWVSEKCSKMEVAQVGFPEMHGRWAGIPFESNLLLGRMAEVWEWHANIIAKLYKNGQIGLARYEDWYGCDIEDDDLRNMILSLPPIETRNDKIWYSADFDTIRGAVKKYCPSREALGYV